jgi:hypothetical protein
VCGDLPGATLKRLGLLGEVGQVRSAGILGHYAALKRVEVLLHRVARLGELALLGGKLCLLPSSRSISHLIRQIAVE